MSTEISHLNDRLAEAASYALMRRLMPAIRHHIAGALQPVGMLSAMLERRVLAATPDMVQLGNNAKTLNGLSREAAATALDLMTWLAPKDNEPVALGSAVEESFGLIATELSFRGFSLVNQTADTSASLPRSVLRTVFTASLIALADSADDAAQVVVTASEEAGTTHLKISLVFTDAAESATGGMPMSSYRALQWADVQALADAHGVQLLQGPAFVQLGYVSVPLKAG